MRWNRIPELDSSSFQYISDWYGKDKKNIIIDTWWGYEIITWIDVVSYVVLWNWYSKNNNIVYFHEKTYGWDWRGVSKWIIVKWADAKTFKILENWSIKDAKDKNYSYFKGKRYFK